MGFCLFNNVAVAAAAMLARGLERVAIVDIDVHHGNGTQAIFYDDPRVLYVSTHQFPFYPGTGAADEIGAGDGAWLHRERSDGGRMRPTPTTRSCIATIVAPVLDEFRPELVLVSAGLRRARTRSARVDADDDGRLRGRRRRICGRRGASRRAGARDRRRLRADGAGGVPRRVNLGARRAPRLRPVRRRSPRHAARARRAQAARGAQAPSGVDYN